MPEETKYHIGIELDRLTNSILNTISGDSFPTDVTPATIAELKKVNKKNGWDFNWLHEGKLTDRKVYKLTITNNPNVIQGLVSISDYTDHYYLHLIESAPFNKGKKKLYEGVGGNLFAFTCKTSLEFGNLGFVLFTSKTKLIEYYQKAIGATPVGGQRMIIFPDAALKLIQKYYPNKK